jgi:hypothetical protein
MSQSPLDVSLDKWIDVLVGQDLSGALSKQRHEHWAVLRPKEYSLLKLSSIGIKRTVVRLAVEGQGVAQRRPRPEIRTDTGRTPEAF